VTERVFLRFLCPLSQKSKIFASSPKGRAKATYGGNPPDKRELAELPIEMNPRKAQAVPCGDIFAVLFFQSHDLIDPALMPGISGEGSSQPGIGDL